MKRLLAREPLQAKSPNPVKRPEQTPKGVIDLTKAAKPAMAPIFNASKRPAPEDDDSDIDDYDPRLRATVWDCNQIRRMIRTLLESGEMKVGEFTNAIGNSSKSY